MRPWACVVVLLCGCHRLLGIDEFGTTAAADAALDDTGDPSDGPSTDGAPMTSCIARSG